jgi:hypothetical protein
MRNFVRTRFTTILSRTCATAAATGGAGAPHGTYFDVVGIPAAVDLDARELQRRMHALQRDVHPDATPGAEDDSAAINAAYQALRDPLARCRYVNGLAALLSTDEGYASAAAARGSGAVLVPKEVLGASVPQDFLERMMELHEILEEDPDTAALDAVEAEATVVATESFDICRVEFDAHGIHWIVRPLAAVAAGLPRPIADASSEASRHRFAAATYRWTYAENLRQLVKAAR